MTLEWVRTQDLVVGKIYLVRGGHILRYHGPWGQLAKSPPRFGGCLAFRHPKWELTDPAVGESIAPEDVRQSLGAKDLEWLELRRMSCIAKKLDHEDIDIAVKEIKCSS